ncbi:MAG: hypothetical protein IJF32_05910 [Oscillospiraceae bacterium]|nr:hypothetical protein [Oscillospiraceae bacterium]
MEIFKLIISTILSLSICLSLSSCTPDSNYETLYHELESDYYELEEDYRNQVARLETNSENYADIIEYYELICKENGFLTYEQVYDSDYYYVEPGSLIYHTDFYCKKANSSNLQIVDIFLYSTLEECAECDAAKYDIRLVDPATKLYHHTYEACAPHFTKDFKTVSTPYIATTEQKAKEMKCAPCPICMPK